MGFWGTVIGFAVGGPVGAYVGDKIGDSIGGSEATVNYGTPPDYSEAMMYASDNNTTVARAQIMGMQMSMQQAGLDREMQLAAQLELGIEKFDTKLQESLLQYKMQMTAEENHHVELMAEIKQKHNRLESGGGEAFFDLPPPDFL
jgi:hypothetical protein